MSSAKTDANIELAKILLALNPQKQCKIIEFLSDDSVDFLCECIFNVCFTDLNLNKRTKRKLKNKISGKYNVVKFLSKKKNSVKSRRKKLASQSGGFLGTVLSIGMFMHVQNF